MARKKNITEKINLERYKKIDHILVNEQAECFNIYDEDKGVFKTLVLANKPNEKNYNPETYEGHLFNDVMYYNLTRGVHNYIKEERIYDYLGIKGFNVFHYTAFYLDWMCERNGYRPDNCEGFDKAYRLLTHGLGYRVIDENKNNSMYMVMQEMNAENDRRKQNREPLMSYKDFALELYNLDGVAERSANPFKITPEIRCKAIEFDKQHGENIFS